MFRSAAERSLATSALSGAMASRLTPNTFRKVMVTANQENFRLGQYLAQKGLGCGARGELGSREELRVHVASQRGLQRMQPLHRLREPEIANMSMRSTALPALSPP